MNHFSPKLTKVCSCNSNDDALSNLNTTFQNVLSKTDVIKAISHEEVLRRIPIELAPNVSKEQAEKDFRRERVILNGVYFIPDKVDMARCEAFALSLRHLVERLQRQQNSSSSKAGNISDTILQRGCRTSAGADSFFMVQKLLCVEGTFVTQKTSLHSEDPIIVDVFLQRDYPHQCNSNRNSIMTSSTIDNRSMDSRSEKGRETEKRNERLKSDCKDVYLHSQKETDIDHSPDPHKEVKRDTLHDSNTIRELNRENSLDRSINSDDDFDISKNKTGKIANNERHNESSLYTRIEVKNFFSVYDISAMDDFPVSPHSCPSLILNEPLPWLEVETILIDESNFKSREHWRRIQLIVTEMAPQRAPSPASPATPLWGSARKPSNKNSYSLSCIPP